MKLQTVLIIVGAAGLVYYFASRPSTKNPGSGAVNPFTGLPIGGPPKQPIPSPTDSSGPGPGDTPQNKWDSFWADQYANA